MFKQILLPVDGSDVSMRAADTGIALAAKLGAAVHGLNVVAPVSSLAWIADIIVSDVDALTVQATAQAQEYLAQVQAKAETAGVACTTSYVTSARPHEAILAAARDHGCDLIVMGTHGWRGADRLLLGSETHRVILSGDVPVLVVH